MHVICGWDTRRACARVCAVKLQVRVVRCYRSQVLLLSRFDLTQAGAFLPRLLEQAGLLETSDDILDLNVILVYKKLVQGLIYSPPDCDKYLALDAKPQVKVAFAPLWPRLWQLHQIQSEIEERAAMPKAWHTRLARAADL